MTIMLIVLDCVKLNFQYKNTTKKNGDTVEICEMRRVYNSHISVAYWLYFVFFRYEYIIMLIFWTMKLIQYSYVLFKSNYLNIIKQTLRM